MKGDSMKKKFIFIGLALSMSIGCLSFKVLEQTIFKYKDNFYRETATLFNLPKKDNYIDEKTRKEIYKDVFTNAIDSVNEELPNYLDIIGLNVPEKNRIQLENFNRNYVVPTFNQYAYSTFQSMQTKFNNEGRKQFNALASSNRKIASLRRNILTQFTNITNEDFETLEVVTTPNSVNSSRSSLDTIGMSPTETIGALLASVGLAAGVAYTILAAASVLIATAPVAWCLPYSVPATIAALLTITGVVLIFWEQISQIFWQLCEAFVACIEFLAEQIMSFFEWLFSQAQTSTIIETNTASTTLVDILEHPEEKHTIRFSDKASLSALLAEVLTLGADMVVVLSYVKKDCFTYQLPLITVEEAIQVRLHSLGYSSWTPYGINAKNMIICGGSGITELVPEVDIVHTPGSFYFLHYHNCQYDINNKIVRIKEGVMSRSHSFFGPPLGYKFDMGKKDLFVTI